MNILFQNNYVHDKEWAKDISGYILFKRPISIVCYIFMLIYFVFGIHEIITIGYLNLVYLFIPLITFCFIIFYYNYSKSILIKRDVEMYGGQLSVTSTITDESISVLTSAGNEYRLNYYDIKKTIQTKKFIYLRSKTNVLYSFKKNSFEIGNAADFCVFLKTKGIRIK